MTRPANICRPFLFGISRLPTVRPWHALGDKQRVVPLRFRLAQALLALVIGSTALVAVGLTAPADAPFSIVVRPVFVSLGVDVDVKVWSMHLHFTWSAIPPAAASTKAAGTDF